MKKEYLKLTLEELLEDREFVAWLVRGKNQQEWESFLDEHADFKSTVNKARKIVNLLRDRHEQISEEELLAIWKNIDNFEHQNHKLPVRFKINTLLRYAAVLVLLLSVSSAGYWFSHRNTQSYVYTKTAEPGSGTLSKLLLSDGTVVDLEKKNSRIAISGDQQVVIDDEKVIDLAGVATQDDAKMNEVVIPFGKKSQLILEDGTKVWLNAGSRMAFPTRFTGNKREVFIEGEAYLEVSHNKDKPFFVNTGEIAIKVLGTKFDISAYKTDNVTEIVLLEGKVAISEQSALGFLKGETILNPNQKASFENESHLLTVKNETDVEFAIAWTEGWFKFSQQSMNNVLNKLQRYYSIQFVYDNDFRTSDLITGKLDLKDSVESVMVALSDVANIRFRIDGDKIYVDKK